MKPFTSLILAATVILFHPFAVSQDDTTALTSASRFTVLHTFKNPIDGLGPGSVIGDSAGDLFGVSVAGGDLNCDLTGSEGCGVVFKLNSTGQETVLHRFAGSRADQGSSVGGLVRDTDGNLYGTTSGNPLYCGTVFKLDKTGAETILHRFTCGTDGAIPLAGLVLDSAGNLYGTTSAGGASGQGVLFRVDTKGNETVLYHFTGGADGGSPESRLIRDSDGNLYGTTANGGDPHLCNLAGSPGCGVVFRLTRTGEETVLHTFTGGRDGAIPQAKLIRDSAGNLYGTTVNGGDLNCNLNGSPGCGVMFKLDATGKLTVLHTFSGKADGGGPSADLVLDAAGNFYGATGFGGDRNTCSTLGCGVVFKLDRRGRELVLHTFTGGLDGGSPGGLLLDSNGTLIGVAAIGGGRQGAGVVFKISP